MQREVNLPIVTLLVVRTERSNGSGDSGKVLAEGDSSAGGRAGTGVVRDDPVETNDKTTTVLLSLAPDLGPSTEPSGLSPRAGGRGQPPKAAGSRADLWTAAAHQARPSPAKLRASAREVSFTNLSPGLRHPRVTSQVPGNAIYTRDTRKFRDERAYHRASLGPRFRPREKPRPQSVVPSLSSRLWPNAALSSTRRRRGRRGAPRAPRADSRTETSRRLLVTRAARAVSQKSAFGRVLQAGGAALPGRETRAAGGAPGSLGGTERLGSEWIRG
ncbi:unnamed protein product [Rangifer tarandus platyrhynchus]|uniref:Uncharacterized protein n=2 Tax=Rangifer tarandus platyrhynchus TaxID=3082113 RepID=A0ABN8Y2T6_RANTA|nr:unnamed protein product [Rangifer tarandus platyrhynchus]CAI9693163.1 unnamed protein product [Rangifer tarandus platyrhynchus]